MTLIRHNPYRNLMTLPGDFDEFFRGFNYSETHDTDCVWRPNVDIVENEKEYELYAELPGIKKEDLNIKVEKGHLILSGEKKSENENKEKNLYHSERIYGKFQRSFRLSDEVKSDAIKAKFADGVLRIEIPKAEKEKPKEISIS